MNLVFLEISILCKIKLHTFSLTFMWGHCSTVFSAKSGVIEFWMLFCLQPSMDYLQGMQSTRPRAPDYHGPWVLGETICRWLIINDICVYDNVVAVLRALNTFTPVSALSLWGNSMFSILIFVLIFSSQTHICILFKLCSIVFTVGIIYPTCLASWRS